MERVDKYREMQNKLSWKLRVHFLVKSNLLQGMQLHITPSPYMLYNIN
jgi:hypothetical protein